MSNWISYLLKIYRNQRELGPLLGTFPSRAMKSSPSPQHALGGQRCLEWPSVAVACEMLQKPLREMADDPAASGP
jgi:hypothetical protein